MGDSREEISDEEYRVSTASKEVVYHFQLEKRLSIAEHMNDFTKLFTDLANVDVEIKEEDKAVILLNSLLDEEYETFVFTLINGDNHLTIMMCWLLL